MQPMEEMDEAESRAPMGGVGRAAGSKRGVAQGGEDQVLEHLDVVGVDGVGRDGHGLELEASGDRDAHGATAARPPTSSRAPL